MRRFSGLLPVTVVLVGLGCGDREKPAVVPQPPEIPSKAPAAGAVPPEVEKLLAQARNADGKVRLHAIRALEKQTEQSADAANAAVPVLVELLKHEDPSTRSAANDALVEVGDARKYRTPDLQGGDNPLLASKDALASIVGTLGDPVKGVRDRVPRQLGQIAEYNLPAAEQIIEFVRPLLKSEQAGTRAAAAEAVRHLASRLGKTRQGLQKEKSPQTLALADRIPGIFVPVVASLNDLDKDADAEVRREAASSLKAIRALLPEEAGS